MVYKTAEIFIGLTSSQTGMWKKLSAFVFQALATLFSQEHQKNNEKVSWRAGKTMKTHDLAKKSRSMDVRKSECRVAGANP